jgi:hypothetical protein
MEQLTENVRDTLIAIGQAARAGKEPRVTDMESLRRLDSINRQRPEFWKNATGASLTKKWAALLVGLPTSKRN